RKEDVDESTNEHRCSCARLRNPASQKPAEVRHPGYDTTPPAARGREHSQNGAEREVRSSRTATSGSDTTWPRLRYHAGELRARPRAAIARAGRICARVPRPHDDVVRRPLW